MRLLGWLYERVWRLTSGRPWTYEIRDWSDRHPAWAWAIGFGVTAGFIAGQMMTVMRLGWWGLPFVLFVDLAAFLAGHLYWDTLGAHVRPKGDFG